MVVLDQYDGTEANGIFDSARICTPMMCKDRCRFSCCFMACEVVAALVVDFGSCMFTAGSASDFCISRCIPFDFGRPKLLGIMIGEDQKDSVQLYRWLQLGCRGGQCSQ